ncbi:MAG: CDP-diacylglycerol--glycerol-3-phosphate 3-phosphatidyltransferase [Tissierellia bacterium]|mgnify:CR=1 FL=1|nr:CDP-diacylglycerol--glycerol-3-phosphate 3-phosphatidyltransferase [Tissierellia bacterium]
MNIPNILTVLRIILVPVYLYLFYTTGEKHLFYAGAVFIIAGITDILDGYIARKYDQSTEIGAALDPLADKLMTFAVLVSFTSAKLIPSWILKILGLKEIVMITGGFILYLFKDNQVLPSNKFGKIATVSFYMAILSVVFKAPYIFIKILFVITVTLNLIAFINYLIIYLSMRNKRSSL